MSRHPIAGSRIDRSQPLSFTFDGVRLSGFAGDTLASALIANDVRSVSRSVTLKRPRGIMAAGPEDPNAWVQLEAPYYDPIAMATMVELTEGLEAWSIAGLGRLHPEPAAERFDRRYMHCDVLVVGAGPSGIAAALAASAGGARVILAEQQAALGGSVDSEPAVVREPLAAWIEGAGEVLRSRPEVSILVRTTATGSYDDNYVILEQRLGEHAGATGQTRRRIVEVRAKRVILATGATERPTVFANNDRPGIMLSSSAVSFAHRYGALAGRRAVVFTTNDGGLGHADELRALGVDVVRVVDTRDGRAVIETEGGQDGALVAVTVGDLDGSGNAERIECDLLAVSGGLDPALGLHYQRRGESTFDAAAGCLVPSVPVRDQTIVGRAAGHWTAAERIRHGLAAGAEYAAEAGYPGVPGDVPEFPGTTGREPAPVWLVPPPAGGTLDSHFVDLHRDVTAAEIARGVGAGLRAMEHVKRFTLAGTGADQGKLAAVNVAAVAATRMDLEPGSLGPSSARPPAVPLSFALLAGRAQRELFDPVRTTPIHSWHVARGAPFENVGQWKRPWYYPRDGESMDEAVLRECAAVRESVGVVDASTLGKIDVQGPDAAEFLNRLYTNAFDNLAVGTCRYGLLCKPDGMVFDDGVVMRLAEDRFMTTTTTGGAAAVLDHMEEYLQTEWPGLRVRLTSVTEQWATVAVVGPRSRDVLARLAPGVPMDNDSFPFMAIRYGDVAGRAARIARVSFSGELAYEINVPGYDGLATWGAVMAAGEPFGITPYGTETMHVLRAEKGFIVVGHETDGTTTPYDLGMGWVVSKKKPFFLGRRSFSRADTSRPDRKQLVGLLPLDPAARLPEGAQLVADPTDPVPMPMIGHVTSSYNSAALGRTFALALVRSGRERMGQVIHAPLGDRTIAATVVGPVFYDPEGKRRDG